MRLPISIYPYKNIEDYNLDYLQKKVDELKTILENFISLNSIKYANPIQWNITTQYEANTVVVDGNNGTAYLSVKAVPSGVAITNTDYWTVIFTLDLATANNNITLRDDGTNILSTFTSSVGDWLLWNGILYKVIRDINVNESYVIGYNIERYTVELFIKDYVAKVESDIAAAVTNITAIIGDLDDLTTTDKSNIIAAINEVLDDLNDEVATLDSRIDSIADDFVYTSPEKFGAVGDGVTDDTEAIQSAIDDGIANHKMVLLTGNYLTSTLRVNNSVEICGGGTLNTFPFRYDSLTSALSDSDRHFTTLHPEYYKPNTFITVHSGSSWQSLVVTNVVDNEIYVAPAFYENASDVVNSYGVGAMVNIHKLCFWIAANNSHSNSDVEISGVNIHDITIKGNQNYYNSTYDVNMDIRYNGVIMIHSIANSKLHHLTIDTANNNMVAYLGKCTNNIFDGNILRNCRNINSSLSSDWLETGCALLTHWSQRFSSDSSELSTFMIISNNRIENCYQGIFISAGSYINVANNNINDIVLRGIHLYSGDLGYSCRNNNVIGNILRNCNQENSNVGVINVLNAIQSRISDNEILLGKNGIYLSAATDIMISDNHLIANTESGIYYYSGAEISIKDNYFNNGAAVASIVLYDHNESSNGGITLDGNVHEGTRSQNNSAIYIVRAKHTIIQNERVMVTNPQRLVTISTANVTLGDVLVKDSFVNAAVAPTAAERNLLYYSNCMTSAYRLQSNLPT